jgi:hypothetical protein
MNLLKQILQMGETEFIFHPPLSKRPEESQEGKADGNNKADKEGKRSTAQKIAVYQSFFSGLTNVYGTYDPANGRSWQEKKPVTFDTLLKHLQGKNPYGVYLLVGDRTRAVAADFDDPDVNPPVEFINKAKHYGLPAYLETSKSKGFHAWVFFEAGV